MYKVFLVEDEIVVREGIRNSVLWENTQYELTGEAPDGELALSMIQELKPDILITDIRMPFMDGLALSRIVKNDFPGTKIIILSGHDEFEYARDALSIGVDEYLLKPVSVQDMIAAMDKLAIKIEEERNEQRSIENLKAKIRSSTDILRDKWLFDFVNGNIEPAEAIEKGKEYGIDFLGRSYVVAVIDITCPAKKEGQLSGIRDSIESIMRAHADSIWFTENEKRFVLLVRETQSTVSGNQAAEKVYEIASKIKHEIEYTTNCRVAVGIGMPAGRLGETCKSYSSAQKILFSMLKAGLFQIADYSLVLTGEADLDLDRLRKINVDLFSTRLKYAAKKDIDSILMEYTSMLGDCWGENPMLPYFLFGEIIVSASKIAENYGGDIREIVPFSLNHDHIQKIISSRSSFSESVRVLLSALIEFKDSHSGGRYQSVIVKAREFIDLNFSSTNVSLFSTAEYVGISPNHLSAVFAKETGENFIGYLTRVRIERAKHLLKETEMKNADIANETGFSDPHYFSYIFKKSTGFSPKEWRLKGKS